MCLQACGEVFVTSRNRCRIGLMVCFFFFFFSRYCSKEVAGAGFAMLDGLNRSSYRYPSSKSTGSRRVAGQKVSQYCTGFSQVYHKSTFRKNPLCCREYNMTCHDVSGEKISYFSLKVRGSKAKMLDCSFVVVALCLYPNSKFSACGINKTSGWD